MVYLFMAMLNSNILNVGLMILLFCITALDLVIRSQTRCTNGIGILFGLIIGGIIGVFWYMLMAESGPKFYILKNMCLIKLLVLFQKNKISNVDYLKTVKK